MRINTTTTIQSRAIISGFILTSLIVLLSTTQLTTTSLLPQQANAQLSTTDLSSIASRIHELVNQARQQNGLSALSWNSNLERIAFAHSQDNANTGSSSHRGSDGSTEETRIKSVQGSNIWWGENISWMSSSTNTESIAQQTFNGWYNEQPPNDIHRRNILNSNFNMEGIGVAQGGDGRIYITQDFSS